MDERLSSGGRLLPDSDLAFSDWKSHPAYCPTQRSDKQYPRLRCLCVAKSKETTVHPTLSFTRKQAWLQFTKEN